MSNSPNVVLLVDDDVLVRNLARRNLEGAGFTVMCAADAAEAMTILRACTDPIHAAVLDVEMRGGVDGITLANDILRERAGTVILLMSGGTSRPIPEHMAFIAKPFLRNELAETLIELLAKRGDAISVEQSEPNKLLDNNSSTRS